MSDPTAPWAPRGEIPPMAEHFREAAHDDKKWQEVSTGSRGQGDSGLQQLIEQQRSTPEAEMHHRPDDKNLVKEVHTQVDAERNTFLDKFSKKQEQDFGPKL